MDIKDIDCYAKAAKYFHIIANRRLSNIIMYHFRSDIYKTLERNPKRVIFISYIDKMLELKTYKHNRRPKRIALNLINLLDYAAELKDTGFLALIVRDRQILRYYLTEPALLLVREERRLLNNILELVEEKYRSDNFIKLMRYIMSISYTAGSDEENLDLKTGEFLLSPYTAINHLNMSKDEVNHNIKKALEFNIIEITELCKKTLILQEVKFNKYKLAARFVDDKDLFA